MAGVGWDRYRHASPRIRMDARGCRCISCCCSHLQEPSR
jgi:hypothetical protein